MSLKIIKQLINGEYQAEGQKIHVPVKSVRIDTGLANKAKDLLFECGLIGKALIVSDENTHAVLASKIAASLAIPNDNSLIFKNGVKPDITKIKIIKRAAKDCDYIIAVGSGTINDLCKYASFLLDKPYVVFGTAPSMNGYGSANASIIMHGHKKTLKAHLPQGIFLDLDILAKAPARLIRSGLGDSLCRPTAQADWLLSHLLLDTFYTDIPFQLLKEVEADLFAHSAALVNGDIETIRLLAETLMLSGFGMYIAGGSYPASQGEHMIAHTMEMMFESTLPHSYHGEQIGITTLTMARLQEEKFQESGISCQNYIFPENSHLKPSTLKECREEYKTKQFTVEKLDSINEKLQNNWGDIKQKISQVILPHDALHKTLKDAGCPLLPKDIGWQDEQYNNALEFTKFSRGRFTFLDL